MPNSCIEECENWTEEKKSDYLQKLGSDENDKYRNYSQRKEENLAIIFALKFHKFVYGIKFLLQTDHCPLSSIYGLKKGISPHTANRLQW